MDKNILNKIKQEEDALNQYEALTHIVFDMLEAKKKECKLFFIAFIISVCVNVVIVGGFLWYESQWERSITETVTTTTEQEVSGTDSDINNVKGDQYNDEAVHNEERGN